MTLFLTVLHVLVCLVIILVVLLQRGKGAEIGAVFGGGASSTVFGSRGAGNFLTKITVASAAIFMITSLSLAYFSETATRSTLFEEADQEVEETSPFSEPVQNPEQYEESSIRNDVSKKAQLETEQFEELPTPTTSTLNEKP